MTPTTIFFIGTAGFIGTLIRYFCGYFFSSHFGIVGLSTVIINVVGCLLIGITIGLGTQRISEPWFTIITVGLLGGFTTFSAFGAETILFLKNGHYMPALIYVLVTVIAGLAATALGLVLAKL